MGTLHPRRSTSTPDELAALFAAQRSLITPAQLRHLGIGLAEQRVRIDRGEWCVEQPGVIGLRGVAHSWQRTMQAATLGAPHAAITAGTALRLHGIDGFEDYDELHAIAPKGRRVRLAPGFRVWESRRLGPADVMVLDGIRTTTLAAALVHAAPVLDDDKFEQALDDALRRGTPPGWLQQTAQRWSGRGVPGSGLLTDALAERLDRRLPRSWFERLARRAFAAQGIVFEHELPLYAGRRRLAVLDLADQRWKVGVECQSWRWHATPRARAADAERKRRLRLLGWDVVEVWWRDLHNMPGAVADVEEAYRRQRILLADR